MKLFGPLDRADEMKLFQIAEKLAHKVDAEITPRDLLYLNCVRCRLMETDIEKLYGSWTIYAECAGKYIYIEMMLQKRGRTHEKK